MRNPWKYKSFKIKNASSQVVICVSRRDIRNGYDLGRIKEEERVVIENIDFLIRKKEYWKNLFNSIIKLDKKYNIPYKDRQKIIACIREERYNKWRPRFKIWDERYSERVVRWARKVIRKNINDPCVDNYRLAQINDKKAMKLYILQRNSGCCGSFDVEKRGPDFRKYWIGCNYGH